MNFKLHIRGRDDFEAAPVANLANPLIQDPPISKLAALAANEDCKSASRFALRSCAGMAVALADDHLQRNTELEAHRFTESLLAAAMRCCDHHGDNEQARADMRHQCLETPQHLQQDLLNHFNSTYGVSNEHTDKRR